MGPVTVHWYDGSLEPPRPADLKPGRRMGEGSNGVLLIGSKGTIMGGGWSKSPRIIPEPKMKAYGRPPQKLPRSPGHHRDWLDACKGGPKAMQRLQLRRPADGIRPARRRGDPRRKKILWDGPNMKVTNAPEAQRFVQEPYRPGFDLASI